MKLLGVRRTPISVIVTSQKSIAAAGRGGVGGTGPLQMNFHARLANRPRWNSLSGYVVARAFRPCVPEGRPFWGFYFKTTKPKLPYGNEYPSEIMHCISFTCDVKSLKYLFYRPTSKRRIPRRISALSLKVIL